MTQEATGENLYGTDAITVKPDSEDKKDGGVHMFPAEKKSVRAFPRPILKWAGGKQQIIDLLLARTPSKYGKYIEPFFGGGALFFAFQTDKAVISDSNP